MSIEYLNKINGNPGFVDGATIPPFASKAALDASGSGWEIGTIANAAGVPYSWRGAGVGWVSPNEAIGEIDNPFATPSARDEYYGGVPSKNTRSWLVNPFAPDGATEFVVRDIGGGVLVWRALPNQTLIDISNPDGSPIIPNASCTGFALGGALTEVYASPLLPDWMFEDGVKFMSSFEGGVKDAASTAVYSFSAGPRSSTDVDINNACHAGSAAAATAFKGCGQSFAQFRIAGAKLYGAAGTTAFGANAPVGRALANITSNSQRILFAIAPGATTNMYYFGRYCMISL